MTIADEIEAGLIELEEFIPDAITWNTKSYPIIPGSMTKGGKLEIGGKALDIDFACTVRHSLFAGGVLPKQGQTFMHGTDAVRIDLVIVAPGNSHVRLVAVSPNRGI